MAFKKKGGGAGAYIGSLLISGRLAAAECVGKGQNSTNLLPLPEEPLLPKNQFSTPKICRTYFQFSFFHLDPCVT